MDDAPVLALFGEDVRAAAVDFTTAAKLHGPVKGCNGGSAIHGHVGLFDAVRKLRSPLEVVVKSHAESGEAANPFVLRGRESDEAAVKHLQGAAQVALVNGAGLCAFKLKDLLRGGL